MPASLTLPTHYRRTEVLAFHGRDPAQLAEKVWAEHAKQVTLSKGLVMDGVPLVIHIALGDTQADYRVEASGGQPALGDAAMRPIVTRMLGLHADPAAFELATAADALLGPVVARQRGLCIPQTATPFEALTWAITGQQITLGFAITLRRRLIEAAGLPHASGLVCYPEAAQVVQLTADQLGAMQFSRAKSAALLRVAEMVVTGELDLDALGKQAMAEAARTLTAIKGIGPWTANYMLMRGVGALDCSLHGDVAVRNALTRLRGDGSKISQDEAERLLARYAPHRSLACAHLWASLATFSA